MSSRLECDEQERKLFVGSLNKANTDEDVLINYFESYGNIIDCTIMRDRDKVSRGFGFILFEDATSVDNIMSAKKDGAEFSIDNHHIEIKRAFPKVPGGNAGSSPTTGLNRKIFVGGLPSTITEQDLRSYFECYGRLNGVELLRDRDTGKLRGFAFVTFDDEDSADKCMQRRQHEICKKICEVKRAQPRSNLGEKDGSQDHSGFYHGDRQQNKQLSAGGGGMSMAEVNQLIQQAFIMGQQSVQGAQLPTVSSLLNNRGAAAATASNSNVILQALMNQQVAPTPDPVASTGIDSQVAELAQLLQSRGINANSLAGLLKKDASPAPSTPADKGTLGYTYKYGYTSNTSGYGPTDDKQGYRPY